MPLMGERAAALEDFSAVLNEAETVLTHCFVAHNIDEIFLSFNGGKDCTVLLDITLNILKKILKTNDVSDKLKVYYIRMNSPFEELEYFVKHIERHYGLKLMTEEGNLKSTLQRIMDRDNRLKACLMGTRRSDPYCENLKFTQKTDPDWPELLRVSPLLNWSYHHIWTYILKKHVPYCTLYDKGYTSIGSMYNTEPNPALAYTNESGNISYHPAWKLNDPALERAGRVNKSSTKSNGHFVTQNGSSGGHSQNGVALTCQQCGVAIQNPFSKCDCKQHCQGQGEFQLKKY